MQPIFYLRIASHTLKIIYNKTGELKKVQKMSISRTKRKQVLHYSNTRLRYKLEKVSSALPISSTSTLFFMLLNTLYIQNPYVLTVTCRGPKVWPGPGRSSREPMPLGRPCTYEKHSGKMDVY